MLARKALTAVQYSAAPLGLASRRKEAEPDNPCCGTSCVLAPSGTASSSFFASATSPGSGEEAMKTGHFTFAAALCTEVVAKFSAGEKASTPPTRSGCAAASKKTSEAE